MMILVIGGSGSGKSSYAEEVVCSVSEEDMKKYYLATMQVFDESMMLELLRRERYAELIKYGVIVVASVPVLCIYPFIQKNFVKGITLGGVKG